jgi:hypothetical protein
MVCGGRPNAFKAFKVPERVILTGQLPRNTAGKLLKREWPPEVSRELFAAAGEPKEFWLAPEAGHNDLGAAGAAGAVEAAMAFVRRHLAPNPPTPPAC